MADDRRLRRESTHAEGLTSDIRSMFPTPAHNATAWQEPSTRHSLYSPLSTRSYSFRLFHLQPGAPGEPIQGQLSEDRISKCSAQYLAGSYVCGSQYHPRNIFVNGSSFHVGQNLYDFLSSIRQRICIGNVVCLWIDAICIDQYSVEERNHQVQMIGDIYHNAAEVVAYVGSESLETAWFFSRLNQTEGLPDRLHEGFGDSLFLNMTQRMMRAAKEFANQPYFTRLWVIQELVLAQRIRFLCDKRVTAWEYLFNWLDDVRASGSTSRRRSNPDGVIHKAIRDDMVALRRSTLYLIHTSRRARAQPDLYKLFCSFGDLACSIPHDKVFALLGMMAQGNTSDRSLTVNYSLDKVSTIIEVLHTFKIDDTIDFVRRALQYLVVDAHSLPVPLDTGDPEITLNLPWAGDASLPYSTKQREGSLAKETWKGSHGRRYACFITASPVSQTSTICLGTTLVSPARTCCAYLISRTPVHKYILINRTELRGAPIPTICAIATPTPLFCKGCMHRKRCERLVALIDLLGQESRINVEHTRQHRRLVIKTRLSFIIALSILFQSEWCDQDCPNQREPLALNENQLKYWNEQGPSLTQSTLVPLLKTAQSRSDST